MKIENKKNKFNLVKILKNVLIVLCAFFISSFIGIGLSDTFGVSHSKALEIEESQNENSLKLQEQQNKINDLQTEKITLESEVTILENKISNLK